MIYADDTQVYIVLDDDSDRALLIPKIERCVDDIKRWSTANDLKLNGDKTEVIHIKSRFRNSSPLPCVQICNLSMEPVQSARNLGVVVQNDLKMELFGNTMCRYVYICFIYCLDNYNPWIFGSVLFIKTE